MIENLNSQPRLPVSGLIAMPLSYQSNSKYQVSSSVDDFKMGRTTKDAMQNEAFYFFIWKIRGEHYSGVGLAHEKKNFARPCLIDTELSIGEIFKYLSTKSGRLAIGDDFSEEDELLLADYLAQGIYLIAKNSMPAKTAEVLQPTYRARLVLRDGSIRDYEDGKCRSNS